MRTDIHRPSVIDAEAYDFIGIWYDPNELTEVGGAVMLMEEKRAIREHMKSTGGKFSNHDHGGTCYVCGAWANYLACFYHWDSNTYILCGEDCTGHLHSGVSERFRKARKDIKDAKERKAGRTKAQIVLAELGLERAWELYEAPDTPTTIGDIVGFLVRQGSLSDKQIDFLRKLVDEHDNPKVPEWLDKSKVDDCPEGRIEITGTILTTKEVSSAYGSTTKMLVKATEGGWTVWGSRPSRLRKSDKGDEVTFTATVKRAEDDSKHGWFSRPR
jgi:hypothetical protein